MLFKGALNHTKPEHPIFLSSILLELKRDLVKEDETLAPPVLSPVFPP